MKISRSYSELITLPTFLDRFEYLSLQGEIGAATFGGYRYLNQSFYNSKEWRKFRHQIIIRDNGCDLAIPGREIFGKIVIHHITPILPEDVKSSLSDTLMDPDNVVCVSPTTHRAIHYGSEDRLIKDLINRKPNDTCPWKEA